MEGTLDYRWQKNGMALGGIGAGSVEICQNGELREWDICNMGKWGSPDVRKQKKLYDYDAHVLPFTVRAKLAGKEPVVRRLCHDRDNGEFRSLMYSWYKEIEKIRWNPNFPVCRLQYEDSGLPIKIEAEFASPFVPGQEALAGTPGFYVTFTITNPSDQEAEVSILGKLKNPVNRGTEQRCLRNQLTAEKGCAQIVMKSDSKKSNASNGSLAWSVSADEVSWILGEFAPYFTNYVMHSMFGVTEESYLFDFWDTGKLPNLGIETIPEFGTELTEEEISLMDEQELDAIFEKLLQIACVRHPYERVHHFDEKLLTQPEMKREFILASIRQIKRIFPDENGQENWGDSALCGSCKLAPGERKQIRFVIGWHFPNHFGDSGRFEGHWYAKRFADAGEVVSYLDRERVQEEYGMHYSDETVALVSLLHDVCKIGCYKAGTRNVKDENGVWQKVPTYNFDDPLPYGHGEKSVYILSGFMRLSREEAFAIRFHMGFSGQEDKGSVGKAFEKFPLAFALSVADMEATYFLEGKQGNA